MTLSSTAGALSLALAFAVIASAACPPANDVADPAAERSAATAGDAALTASHAGAARVDDAGAAPERVGDADAPTDEQPSELAVDPRGFRFVRLRSPTVGGDEVVRVGLGERVRLVDGAPETRPAPSAESLAIFATLCADRDVAAALTAPGTESAKAIASATTLELACAPLSGTLVCEGTCSPAFDKVRAAVVAAWREELASPEAGIDVRATAWTLAGAAATVAPARPGVVLRIDGKALLPAKERPFARVLAGQTARLCPAPADGAPAAHTECIDVVAPALVHLDVIDGASRWRCSTCTAAAAERSAAAPGASSGRVRTRKR